MVVDIIYECADICEHEFDVEVELGSAGTIPCPMLRLLLFGK